MTLHLDLKEKIESRYGERLPGGVTLAQDALIAAFEDGLTVEVRYANAHEYSIAWRWGEALLRIDTAPVHPGLATFPNHLHDAEGKVDPDPLTVPGQEPWENLCRVLDTLLRDPLALTR